jgi:hypothetical protein
LTYYLQAIFLAIVSLTFCQRRGKIDLALLVVSTSWFIGVSIIFWRYGVVGQNDFYQNDQRFHWEIVTQRISSDLNGSFYQLNTLRVPYTLPAFVLAKIGFDATLSLKFVSLCCALANVALVRKFIVQNGRQWSVFAFWLVAGPMITFFSMLALRETMMLLCVSYLFLRSSINGKIISLIALVVLRPHLAAAVAIGLVWGHVLKRIPERTHLTAVILTAVVPIYLGIVGFPLGQMLLSQRPFNLDNGLFLREQFVQVFSAFVGLQFVTVAYQTVEFSTYSLILVRAIFPEIVLIPLLFVASSLFYSPKLAGIKFGALASFVFFTSVSTGTEFLSVRQSLPFMTTLGAIAILTFSRNFEQIQLAALSPTTSYGGAVQEEFSARSSPDIDQIQAK